jgi:ubiquinone/menaquinone biosynthesis C-methylase UbiE
MSFDRLAPHYRWMETILAGRKMQICRTEHMCRIVNPRRVLMLGEGPGKFLEAFCRRFKTCEITCIDSSRRMLALAEERLRAVSFPHGQIQFVHADIRSCDLPSASFDLIVSHFFLDCFQSEELQHLIPKISRSAMPQASWLLADFGLPETGIRRVRARAIHSCMYLFFRITTGLSARTLTPPDKFLRTGGFTLLHRTTYNLGLLHSDLWSLGADTTR